jgi:hypothetical protein
MQEAVSMAIADVEQATATETTSALFTTLRDLFVEEKFDLSIVHAFAAQPFPLTGVHPYSLIDFESDKLLGTPGRWVSLPNDECREDGEKATSKRLGEDRNDRSKRRADGRFFVAEQADKSYRDLTKRCHEKFAKQDVRWATQHADDVSKSPEAPPADPFLYRLYAKNLDVLGDKASRDLYTFTLLKKDGIRLSYSLVEREAGYENAISPSAEGAGNRTVNLRLFLVAKQLANQDAEPKDVRKKIGWFFRTPLRWLARSPGVLFAPVVAVAAVLVPDCDAQSDQLTRSRKLEQMLELSMRFAEATFTVAGSGKDNRPLSEVLLETVQREIGSRESVLSGIRPTNSTCFEWRILPWPKVTSAPWSLKNLALTQVSAFILGLRGDLVDQSFITNKLALSSTRRSRLRALLIHFFAALCDPSFRASRSLAPHLPSRAKELRYPDVARHSLRRLVKDYFPAGSSVQQTSNTLSIVSPGRKVLIRSLPARAACGTCDGSAPTYDYNSDDALESAAWNLLLMSLVVTQEAQLQAYHAELSQNQNIERVQEALNDFDDLFDVSLFDLPSGAWYRDSFEQMKFATGIDRQYEALDKKLEILQETRELQSLKAAKFSIVLAFVTFFAAFLVQLFTLNFQWREFGDVRSFTAMTENSALSLGCALLEERRLKLSMLAFRLGAILQPKEPDAHMALAHALFIGHQFGQAWGQLREGIADGAASLPLGAEPQACVERREVPLTFWARTRAFFGLPTGR